MRINILLFLLLNFLNSYYLKSQNLINNAGFENFKKCPNDLTLRYKKELVPGWVMPTLGTADYFNICSKNQVGVPQNFMGYCLPYEGFAYIGLILLLEPPESNNKSLVNYREYIQAKLSSPLLPNKNYEISFYYFVSSYSTYAINRLGVYMSEDDISNKLSSGVLNFKPQVSIDSTSINTENDVWFAFKTIYKAVGGEKYLTIGNFYDDNKTDYKLRDLSDISQIKRSRIITEQVSYYYIDKVSVIELKDDYL